MKKLIQLSLTLILVLSLSSCSSKSNKYVDASKEYGYMHAFNCSWGMSIDECLDEFKLEREDVKIIDEQGDGYFKTSHYLTNGEFFEQDASIEFVFETAIKNNIELGLTKIWITLSEPIESELAKEKIVTFLSQQGLQSELSKIDPMELVYENPTTLATLDKKTVAKKAEEFAAKVYHLDDPTESQKDFQENMRAYIPIKPLDSVKLYCIPENGKQPNYGPVTNIVFIADAALYLSNSLFYE